MSFKLHSQLLNKSAEQPTTLTNSNHNLTNSTLKLECRNKKPPFLNKRAAKHKNAFRDRKAICYAVLKYELLGGSRVAGSGGEKRVGGRKARLEGSGGDETRSSEHWTPGRLAYGNIEYLFMLKKL